MREGTPWYQSYDPGFDMELKYSDVPLADQFKAVVRRQPDQAYLYHQEQVLTYRQLNTDACAFANALMSLGVKKGDRVAIALPNIPEFVIAVHACLKLAAIIIPLNPRYTLREFMEKYADSGAETVVCMADGAQTQLEIVRGGSTDLKNVITVSVTASGDVSEDISLLDFYELLAGAPAREPATYTSLNDLVLILYTGGTTGVSKGCCVSNANLIAVAAGWAEMCRYFTDLHAYKVLCTCPFYHIYGFQTAINANILLGGSIVLMPEITEERILEYINRYEPNVWPAVPALVAALSRHAGLAQSKVNRLQLVSCGSAPLPLNVMQEFERISGVPILEGYGASETSMAITANPFCRRKPHSVGVPYPNVEVKVVDLHDRNRELDLGEIGELCFRGPQVVREYWRKTEESLLNFSDGWWYSGDIGYLDRDGYIFIVDRQKDMVICSGFNVYCREIDEVLNNHPKLLEAGVVGIPDSRRGETVKAYVVVKPGENVTADELRAFCRQSLVSYKVPTHWEFIDKLPRTPLQKLDRKALRNHSELIRTAKSDRVKGGMNLNFDAF